MADQGARAQLNYLHSSAHLLSSTSPAVSRHLMARVHALARDTNLGISEAQIRDACGACGNIMIPGWTSRTYLEKDKPSLESRTKTNGKGKGKTGSVQLPKYVGAAAGVDKSIVHECWICNRKSRQRLPTSSRPDSTKHTHVASPSTISSIPGVARLTPLGPKSEPEHPISSSVNASSRRRAKSRKQGGLQALLAKKKEDESKGGMSTGFGLDLMDFMKTG